MSTDPRNDFTPTTSNDEEIAWVRGNLEPNGDFEGYVVIEPEPGRFAVCGYRFHNGPYQQFYHMEAGEQEFDIWDMDGGGVWTYQDEESVRQHLLKA